MIHRRTRQRLSCVVISYIVAVFTLENTYLFLRYTDTVPNIQLHFPDIYNSSYYEDVPRTNCSSWKCNEIYEDDEHYPVRVEQPKLYDPHGRPYTLQSLPENAEEKAYYRLRHIKVNPFNHKYLINSSKTCNEKTTIIAMVNSKPSHFDRRMAIRETWGSLANEGSSWPHNRKINGQLKVVFVFGMEPSIGDKLLNESRHYGDVVQGDFVDSYRNLTLKTLMGMQWIIDFCPGVSYYLKSDDDMVVNIPYLLDILTARPSLQRTIMGPLGIGSLVLRGGKWGLDKKLYPFRRYPPYEPGAAYVMTADLVGELFQAAEYFPHIFIDDVYITGILGRTLAVNHARQRGFAFLGTRPPSGCDLLKDSVITGHNMAGTKLINVWKEMLRETRQSCLGKVRTGLLFYT